MKQKGNRKTLTGVVVSDKMDKTVVVMVERTVLHRRFKKYVTRGKRTTSARSAASAIAC